jgi:hypothetical protein
MSIGTMAANNSRKRAGKPAGKRAGKPAGKRAGKPAGKRAGKPAGKRASNPAASPTINPEPVVVPPAPGGYRKTEGTDRCPVEGSPVTFSSNNNLRAITIHVRGIVKKERHHPAP